MAWTKQSADASVAGLTEWEVVRGVMQGEVDVDLPDILEKDFIKVVSTVDIMYSIHLNNCWRCRRYSCRFK